MSNLTIKFSIASGGSHIFFQEIDTKGDILLRTNHSNIPITVHHSSIIFNCIVPPNPLKMEEKGQ
jgi:hypothetical protein